MKWIDRLLWRFFVWWFWPASCGWSMTSGSRVTRRRVVEGCVELVLCIRDLEAQHVYSREEVYQMLVMVRREERRMAWKCPEPYEKSMAHDVIVLTG